MPLPDDGGAMVTRHRFRLVGDHSGEHCGCAAVIQALREILAPHGYIVGPRDAYDVLVVNGEGSMHHGRRAFHRKMHDIRVAQDTGKAVWLLNSVWQDNPPDYDDCLARLDDFSLRGVASARDLKARHGLDARTFIDLSYFAPVDETASFIDLKGRIAVTDIHHGDFGFAWISTPAAEAWSRIDMREMSWSSLVRTLRTARVLIGGRHHAIYAACRARTPFIPVRGNSHKIEDLLQGAGVDIPIAESIYEIEPLIRHASQSGAAYRRLFDWMEGQPAWSPPGAGVGAEAPPAALPEPPSLVERANAALFRRAYPEAGELWSQALAKKPKRPSYPRNAIKAMLFAGRVEEAIPLLAVTRTAKPESIAFTQLILTFARASDVWHGRDTLASWWSDLRNGAYQVSIGDDGGLDRIDAAIDRALVEEGEAVAAVVTFMAVARLVQMNRHAEAFALHQRCVVPGVPDQLYDHENVLLDVSTRRYGGASLARLERAQADPAWTTPSYRCLIIEGLLMAGGATQGLADVVLEACTAFPEHAGLRALMISILGEMDRLDLMAPLQLDERKILRPAALRNLPLARHLVRLGRDEPDLAARAVLLEEFERGRDQVLAILGDPAVRVAVVGNSPVELGRKQGVEIDAHDLVLRFNDFDVQPPFDGDYGRRTDIVCQTYPIGERMDGRAGLDDALWLQRHAFNLFNPRDWSPVLAMHAAGRRFAYLPREAFLAAAREIEATPSAGFCIAHYMKRLRGRISRENFFGFSFVDQLEPGAAAHYFDGQPAARIHDWRREALAFEQLFV